MRAGRKPLVPVIRHHSTKSLKADLPKAAYGSEADPWIVSVAPPFRNCAMYKGIQ